MHIHAARTRLLVVGMHNSPHLQRWVRMVARPDVAILVFPSLSFKANLPEGYQPVPLEAVSAAMPAGIFVLEHETSRMAGDEAVDRDWSYVPLSHTFIQTTLLSTPEGLRRCLERFRPHLLHAMETQVAGYLCAETARRTGEGFPPFVHSTWGSDLNLFRKLPGHAERLRNVFPRVRAHLADCARDQVLARRFGYRGPDVPIVPSSGGMDIDEVAKLGARPPSERRRILVKGYHDWAGRAMIALSAIMLARRELAGFSIGILVAGPDVRDWARRMGDAFGMDVEALDYSPEHMSAIRRLAEARLVVGLSISDGLPTTVLEAMTVGTFPVQSATGCCDDWIENGRTGSLVPHTDSGKIADAIVRAAHDDALVDTAARANIERVRARWNLSTNSRLAWEIYDRVLAERGGAA